MVANVKFLIYAYGNVVYGEEGASYDSEPLKKIRLRTDASYKDLLNEIWAKVKIDSSAHQINKVLHRHPKFVGGRVHYSLVPIQDDSDVEDLIEMAKEMGERSIQELYIEISNGPLRRSEASNPPPGENHEEFLTNTKGRDGEGTSRGHSSSTPPTGKNYEVFLSFRGEDTRYGFTDHLYRGLVNVGVWAFRDNEELHVGEQIGPELLKAIGDSRISIPIISKNYASSRWCLMELVQILTHKKTSGQIVLPIFYQVTPSEVRNQTGDFGNGFLQCKKKHDVEGRFAQEWKDALMKVTNLKGWESSQIANGHEAEIVRIVVNKVLKVLKKKTLHVSAHLVGVESHVEKIIESTKSAEGSSDVQAIIVHGMGGIGKTTLAKVVYNQLYDHFEQCSFIANIREASLQHKGMENLQKQLISDISGQQQDIRNIDEGINIIKARCEGKRVLFLLDDVGHKDQVNALAGEPNWFGRGSIIIITSRNMDVIEKWKSSLFYELDSLDTDQSFLLFKKHAFKENGFYLDEHGTLAEDIFSATGGLPLAIEIVGSYLHDKKKDIWEDTLKMLKAIPHDDVQKRLKLSYDALHPDEREIFLDIACLPIRKDREPAIYMWERCNFFKQRLNNLVSRSMIKYGEKRSLLIHDQLRDLGREIVRQESVCNPGDRSRIWNEEDAWQVLESKQGTPNVQALCFGSRHWADEHCTSQQFEGMNRLRFLHMRGVQLTGNFENLFLNLQWLWWDYSITTLDFVGINFRPKRLVVLQLHGCNVTEHWTGWSEMKYLKVLELSNCNALQATPDFSAVEELEVLVLSWCDNLREIDSSIGKFSKSLKVLDVSQCRKLKELPKEVGKMEELRKLDISETWVREIPIFEGYLTKLETLSAFGCRMLTELPEPIGKLKLLTELNLHVSGVTKLPDSIGNLHNLEKLGMSYSETECLPTSIGKLHKLQKLDLRYCGKLREIPESIGKLKLLTEVDLYHSGVTKLPDSMGNLYNLEQLDMCESRIECLPTSIGKLHKLQKLDLRCCAKLREIPESIGKSKLLTELNLCLTCVTQLPDSVGDLYNLGKLLLQHARQLEKIPKSIGKLKLLTELDLSHTHVTKLPLSIGGLRDLKSLSMRNSFIRYLPTSIGKLNKLQQLDLGRCSSLKRIPMSIGKLKSLIMLNLEATGVTYLPDSIGGLYNLEVLIMPCSQIKFLPASIAKLTKLKALNLERCDKLQSLPNLPCSLEFISFYGDSMETLPDFSNLTNLNHLIYEDLFQRRSRELNLGKLNQLEQLNIYGFYSEEGIDMAPENFCLLLELPLNVKQLYIIGCQTLYSLPNLSTLKNLFWLRLQNRSKLWEINGLEGAESLVNVHISGCHPKIKIPDLSMLRNLTELTINNDGVMDIPGLQELKSLQHLDISGCKSLKYLPDLSQFENLKALDIRGCTELRMSLDLPEVKIKSDPLEI